MSDEVRVRELGLPPMTDRDYRIYLKRQEFIKAGDTKGLEEFNAKLEKQNKKVEQEIKEDSSK